MVIRLGQLSTQKIQQYPEEKQRTITIAQNTGASSFRFASLVSGVHQTYTRVKYCKDVPAAKAVK
jgi:hypothetical protein